MKRAESPEQALRRVTIEIIVRAIRLGRKKKRRIFIAKTARGRGVAVETLDPSTPEGRAELDKFFKRRARHYTVSGLGAPEEKNAINWRALNAPFWRRLWLLLAVGLTLFLKGNPFKNRVYRLMGVHIGRNVEIMQMAWLDHFRPELIFIGDNTLLGAFTRVTVHAYEGCGRFRFGLVEIGRECTIGAGTGLGVMKMGDRVRTLPGTVVSPYFPRLESGAVVGFAPPPKKIADKAQAEDKRVGDALEEDSC